MQYDHETLRRIFDKTAGRCHLCGEAIGPRSYGVTDSPLGWEVEHSHARANGGTDHPNNLYPAHITCNREKGTTSTRTARSWHDRQRAPL